MGELTPALEQLLDSNKVGVIATRAADEHPQQSVVYHAPRGDHLQRISGADRPPEPQTDEALAEVGRVLLELTIERVSAVTHI